VTRDDDDNNNNNVLREDKLSVNDELRSGLKETLLDNFKARSIICKVSHHSHVSEQPVSKTRDDIGTFQTLNRRAGHLRHLTDVA
jgi:hypothetical protein